MSEKKTKPWGRRNCLQSSETGLCRGTGLGKGTKTFLKHWRSTRTQWPPSFLNGRSVEPPRLFLELATRPNWTIRGEGPWTGKWLRTRWPLWTSYRVPLSWWANLPEGQPSLQHCTNQAFMVEWPDESHSSVKGTTARLEFAKKAPKGHSNHEKLDSLGWWNQYWSLWPELKAKRHIWRKPGTIPTVKHGAVGMFST